MFIETGTTPPTLQQAKPPASSGNPGAKSAVSAHVVDDKGQGHELVYAGAALLLLLIFTGAIGGRRIRT